MQNIAPTHTKTPFPSHQIWKSRFQHYFPLLISLSSADDASNIHIVESWLEIKARSHTKIFALSSSFRRERCCSFENTNEAATLHWERMSALFTAQCVPEIRFLFSHSIEKRALSCVWCCWRSGNGSCYWVETNFCHSSVKSAKMNFDDIYSVFTSQNGDCDRN